MTDAPDAAEIQEPIEPAPPRSDAELANDPSVPYADRLAAATRALRAGTRTPPSVRGIQVGRTLFG